MLEETIKSELTSESSVNGVGSCITTGAIKLLYLVYVGELLITEVVRFIAESKITTPATVRIIVIPAKKIR